MKSIAVAIGAVMLSALTPGQVLPARAQVPQAPQLLASTQPPQPAQGERERTPAPPRAERDSPPLPPQAPPPPAERRPVPQRNVKVDVTITDQTGSATPVKKVVSLVLADGRNGGVRSMTSIPPSDGMPPRELPLNVDAMATVTNEQRVLLDLRFNYSSVVRPVGASERPAAATDAERANERAVTAPRPAFTNVTQNLVVLLIPGQSAVVARSADAAADRTVTVEVRADIVK